MVGLLLKRVAGRGLGLAFSALGSNKGNGEGERFEFEVPRTGLRSTVTHHRELEHLRPGVRANLEKRAAGTLLEERHLPALLIAQ